MNVAKTLAEFLRYRASLAGSSIAFIPTMGNLHAGHLSLITLGKQHADAVVSSIFVNPAQFAPNEDFLKYPRTLEEDVAKLQKAGAKLLFAPRGNSEIYLPNHITRVFMGDSGKAHPLRNEDPNGIGINWLEEQPEALRRPSFFDGIATVLTKLFNIVRPNVVVFGQKDAVQCIVVKQLVKDLNFVDIKVVIGETGREKDGLAMSSRNQYLRAEDRKAFGPILFRNLTKAKENCIKRGVKNENDVKAILEESFAGLNQNFHAAIKQVNLQDRDAYNLEYLTMCDNETGHVFGTVWGRNDGSSYVAGRSKQIDTLNDLNLSVVMRVNGTRLLENVMITRK